MKLDILFVVAHPDDAEISGAGTIAKSIALGQKVGVVDLTQGEMGTRGTPESRAEEAATAAEVLGLHARHNLGMADCFFENNKQHQFPIIEQIRKYRPDIVVTNAVRDRHPDHGKASKLVSDSCFLSGLRRIETSLDGPLQEAWRPRAVYHMIQDRWIEPDFIMDISGYFEVKMKAVQAFKSQFHDPESDEPQTPISSPQFFQALEGRALQLGRLINVQYGEGYTVERSPGVNELTGML